METLTLAQLIGDEIAELRYHYVPEDEYGLQTFKTYIRLKSGHIIDIPIYDNNDYLLLSPENLDYFKSQFDKGMAVGKELKCVVVGQKIVDFHFEYDNDEQDFFSDRYIQLANGMYLTENNCGPVGLTNIDVFALDRKQFADKTRGQDMRSFVATKKSSG